LTKFYVARVSPGITTRRTLPVQNSTGQLPAATQSLKKVWGKDMKAVKNARRQGVPKPDESDPEKEAHPSAVRGDQKEGTNVRFKMNTGTTRKRGIYVGYCFRGTLFSFP